jgi:hypothetical protein
MVRPGTRDDITDRRDRAPSRRTALTVGRATTTTGPLQNQQHGSAPFCSVSRPSTPYPAPQLRIPPLNSARGASPIDLDPGRHGYSSHRSVRRSRVPRGRESITYGAGQEPGGICIEEIAACRYPPGPGRASLRCDGTEAVVGRRRHRLSHLRPLGLRRRHRPDGPGPKPSSTLSGVGVVFHLQYARTADRHADRPSARSRSPAHPVRLSLRAGRAVRRSGGGRAGGRSRRHHPADPRRAGRDADRSSASASSTTSSLLTSQAGAHLLHLRYESG